VIFHVPEHAPFEESRGIQGDPNGRIGMIQKEASDSLHITEHIAAMRHHQPSQRGAGNLDRRLFDQSVQGGAPLTHPVSGFGLVWLRRKRPGPGDDPSGLRVMRFRMQNVRLRVEKGIAHRKPSLPLAGSIDDFRRASGKTIHRPRRSFQRAKKMDRSLSHLAVNCSRPGSLAYRMPFAPRRSAGGQRF